MEQSSELVSLTVYIYTDGASRNNPGKSASGYRIFDEKHGLIVKSAFYNGIKTNNEAEYLAIIAALEKAVERFGHDEEVRLFSDSEVAVRQLTGRYRVKEKGLKALNAKAAGLIKGFRSCRLENVSRENMHISAVDRDLNLLLDSA